MESFSGLPTLLTIMVPKMFSKCFFFFLSKPVVLLRYFYTAMDTFSSILLLVFLTVITAITELKSVTSKGRFTLLRQGL